MKFVNLPRPGRCRALAGRHLVALGAMVALGAWLLGCGADNPSDVGHDLRTPPDTLRTADIRLTTVDSVFHIAGTLGRSPTAQLGQQYVYTAHVLVAFKIPAFVLETVNGVVDTLRADDLQLAFQTDSMSAQPFTGRMRLGLFEVAPSARGWTAAAMIDSPIVALPTLEPDALAPDTVITGAELVNHAGRFKYTLTETRIAGWDTLATPGDSVEVNAALEFMGFTTPGRGFLEFPYRTTGLNSTSRFQLNGFTTDRATAIVSAAPFRVRNIVVFDSAYNPGSKVVASDGHRFHTYLKFGPFSTATPQAVPESALIHLAELILTQTDTLTGTSFGAGPVIGVVIPLDTLNIYSDSTAARALAFKTTLLAPVPGGQVVINITPYVFDQRDGRVANRGMILRLSNEGTKARHFEFYGSAAADSTVRPRLHIVYGMPARFEGGR